MYDVDDKVTQCCVLSRPWIKFQLRNLVFDDVAAGVPNGSWEHFNHRRLLHAQEPSHVSQQIKLTHGHGYHGCYFLRWHGTICMQPTDKTRNSVDAFTG